MQNPFDQQTGGSDFVEWAKNSCRIFPHSVIGEPYVTPDLLFSKVDYFKKYKGKRTMIPWMWIISGLLTTSFFTLF